MRRMLIATVAVASVFAGGATIAQTPHLTSLIPFQIPPITGPGPVTIGIGGTGFIPGVSQVYANGLPMLTTVTSSTALTFQLTNGVLQAALPGAVTLTIVNPPNLASNSGPLMIGYGPGGSYVGGNRGVIGFHPLGYAPGQSIQLSLESFWPNQPFALMADTGTPLPIAPFPPPIPGQPGGFFVLGVTPFGPGFSIVMDGIGLLGPPNPLFVTQPSPTATFPGGSFLLPPFQTPSPPSGLFVSLQVVYLDIFSPIGWTLSWTRFPFSL